MLRDCPNCNMPLGGDGGCYYPECDAPRTPDLSAPRVEFTPEWCLNMARLEGDAEISAGMPDHPLRLPPRGEIADEARADALAKALCLLDSFAGEGLCHVYGNGQTLDADMVCAELAEAFGVQDDADWWRQVPRLAFAAATPAPVVGDGECDCAARFYGDDRNAHQLSCATFATTPASVTPDAGEIERVLADSNAVHLNMLRGGIAKPSIKQIIHLYGEEALRDALPLTAASHADKGEVL